MERIPDLQLAAITDVIAAGPQPQSIKMMHSAAKTLLDEVRRLRAKYGDVERCEICDWPIAASPAEGCMPGNCSFRPDRGTEDYKRIQARREELANGNWMSKIIEGAFEGVLGGAHGVPASEAAILKRRARLAAQEIKLRINTAINQVRQALDVL